MQTSSSVWALFVNNYDWEDHVPGNHLIAFYKMEEVQYWAKFNEGSLLCSNISLPQVMLLIFSSSLETIRYRLIL